MQPIPSLRFRFSLRRVVPVALAALITGLVVLVSTPAASAADGEVRITEYQYNGSEFVEITNLGDAPADMTGWSFSDSNRSPGNVSLAGFGVLAPGESAILAEDSAASFRTAWGLGADVKVIGDNTRNLGRSDEINIYDAGNTLIDRLTYNDQGSGTVAGPRTDNASAWVPADAVGANTANAWVKSTIGDAEDSWAHANGYPGSPGTSTLDPVQEPVSGLRVAVGGMAACALLVDDDPHCWGRGNFGTLGTGGTDDAAAPVPVDTAALPSGTRFTETSLGLAHSCALAADGTVYCWGHDGAGQVGNGPSNGSNPVFAPAPIDVSALPSGTTFTTVAAAQTSSCAADTDGQAYCWGFLAGAGSPVAVDMSSMPAGSAFSSLAVGWNSHACGLVADGAAYCWGHNDYGRLGNGTTGGESAAPVAVAGGLAFASITAGVHHTCGLTEQGAAYCWGSDGFGQLGSGASTVDSNVPVEVDLTGVPGGALTALSSGGNHSCGIAVDGSAWCWGRVNDTGIVRSTPVAIDMSGLPTGTQFTSVSAGTTTTCATSSDDAAYCWGSDAYGLLGNGPLPGPDPSPVPVAVQFGLGSSGEAPTIDVADPLLVGAVGDPDNPSTTITLADPDTGVADLGVEVTVANSSVVAAGDVVVAGDGAERTVTITPSGRGVTDITLVVADPEENIGAASLTYASSAQAADPSGRYHLGISDASAALDVGDGHVLLLNDETNDVFLHATAATGRPVRTTPLTSFQTYTSDEVDFEGIARNGDMVILSASHGNNRSGNVREERRRIVGMSIEGSGATTELNWLGVYTGMWDDLKAWDAGNGHGLGADALGFAAATAPGVLPNAPGGFNIEGIEFSPDGHDLYLGFRAPTVDINGERHALIVPLSNPEVLVDGRNDDPGLAQFGAPILLDLDGRSIREIRKNDAGQYLISAGPSPQNESWALYAWDGETTSQPQFNRTLPEPDTLTGGTWEAISSLPANLEEGAVVRLVGDSGDTNYYGTGQTKDLPTAYQKSYSQEFTLAAVDEPGEPVDVSGVVGSSGGGPVSGACVYLYPGSETGAAVYASCAQGDGSFGILGVEPGEYTVAAADPAGGHVTWWSPEPVTVQEGMSALEITLEVPAGGGVRGTVSDAAGPVGGVCVYAYPADVRDAAAYATCADGAGAYGMFEVAPAGYDLAFFDPAGGHETGWNNGVAVTAGAPVVVDAVLDVVGVVSGVVTGSSGPLAGACVYLYTTPEAPSASYATCTSGDGSYWLGGIPDGEYELAVSDPSGGHETSWQSVTVTGSVTVDVSLDAVMTPVG